MARPRPSSQLRELAADQPLSSQWLVYKDANTSRAKKQLHAKEQLTSSQWPNLCNCFLSYIFLLLFAPNPLLRPSSWEAMAEQRGLPACGITGGTCAFMGGLWEHQGTNQPPRAGAEAATHRSHSKAIKKTQRTCPCLFRAETSRCVPCPPARAAAQPQATRPPGAALPHGLRMDKGENGGGGDGDGGCRCDARG